MLHETICDDDFSRNTAFDHCYDIVSNGYNMQRCVASLQSTTTAAATKTFWKVNSCCFKLYCACYTFWNSQMLAFFSGVEFEKTCNEVQEQKKKVVDLCSRPPKNVKLSIFTSYGSRAVTAKKCAKQRDARAELLFSHCRCRRRRRCLRSLIFLSSLTYRCVPPVFDCCS